MLEIDGLEATNFHFAHLHAVVVGLADVDADPEQHCHAVLNTNGDANTHAVIDVVVNANPLSIFAHAIGNALLYAHPIIFCGTDGGDIFFDFVIGDGIWFV